MHMRLFAKRAVGLLLCLLMALIALPASAQTDLPDPVRVGFFAFDGYHMRDENDQPSGYGYDILQFMSGYTDLHFSFVGYEASWSEAQEMLARGEIDLLTSAQKTEERLARFDFSDRPIGTSSAMLTVRAGNLDYSLDDYQNWSGMRVGMIEGNSRNEHFTAFAVEHGFTYSTVYYADTDEMLAALQEGSSIDAVITSNLRHIENEWILAQFDSSPFYVMVKKGNTALLDEINRALDRLFNAMPEIDSLLMNKYYLTDSGDNIAFTVAERALVEDSELRPVTVGIIPNSEPVCYYQQASGEYLGISMDILHAVARKTGLHFTYVPLDLVSNAPVAHLKAGSVDLVAGILKTQTFISDPTLSLSGELIPDSLIMVGRAGDDFTENPVGKTIVVPAGFQMGIAYVAEQFPEHRIVTLPTFDACMDAVSRSDADALIYMRASISYALQNPHYEKLSIVPAFSRDVSTCIAGLSEDSDALIGIIDKGLAMISDSERNAILLNYTILNPYQMSFSDTLYRYRVPIIVILVLLTLIITGLVATLIMRRKTAEKLQTAFERTKEALTLAENANASKSRFLSRVSHEMRTPLNAIIGFLSISKDADYRDVSVYLTNADIAAKQLLAVINDVLDMSSIEAGKLRLSHETFDFRALLHSVTNIYLPQCLQKGIRFEARLLTPVDEWFVGDQLRVNQILYNLLGNAVKFTRTGHIWLSVSQTNIKGNDVVIRMQVEDTGCGMSDDMQRRLFTPFEQESDSTAVRFGGNGLGLSIVKNLVSMMNGAIRVESTLGEGTVFTVDIPFTRQDAPESIVLPEGEESLRVLTVDDEEAERNYLDIILNRMGVRHTGVCSGAEAIEELDNGIRQNDPYRICLVDWKMPEMDGAETTRRIRSRFGKNVLVLVASAYELNQAGEAAREAGADMFIPKPLFQSALYDLFMTLTGGRLGEAQRSAAPGERNFTGKRVLLAEDNAMNRMVADAIIKKLGLQCECAEDGAIAAEKFAASPAGYFNAILMDIQMPNIDGFEATRRIRLSAHPNAAAIPIIALTANAFHEDIARSLSAGMNAHVSKPIEPEELAKALEKAFLLNPV